MVFFAVLLVKGLHSYELGKLNNFTKFFASTLHAYDIIFSVYIVLFVLREQERLGR